MKKLLFAFIILLFIPSIVFSGAEIVFDNHPAEYIGCWCLHIPHSATQHGDQVFIYIFNADGSMSIVYSLDNSETATVSLHSGIGKWTVINDVVIFQRENKDTYGLLDYHDGMLWFSFEGATFGMKKVPLPDVSQVIYPDMSTQ